MTEDIKMTFNEKVISIQNKLKAPKSQYSEYGNYNYRNCEDILKAVKPLNQEMKLLLTLTDEPVVIGNRFYIKATAVLTDGKEKLEITAYAREADSRTKMDDSQ
ncbi:TPA: ERF family protein, partial [Enterococcus hirae]